MVHQEVFSTCMQRKCSQMLWSTHAGAKKLNASCKPIIYSFNTNGLNGMSNCARPIADTNEKNSVFFCRSSNALPMRSISVRHTSSNKPMLQQSHQTLGRIAHDVRYLLCSVASLGLNCSAQASSSATSSGRERHAGMLDSLSTVDKASNQACSCGARIYPREDNN